MSNDIATRDFTEAELSEIKSFEDALNALTAIGATRVDSTEFGSGFVICEDKNVLVGVPFIILSAMTHEGDFGDFVSLEVVTKNNDKFIVNDGSTGIFDQIRTIVSSRVTAGVALPDKGIYVPNGLTKSDYWRNEDTGETSTRKPEGKGWVPARTFYLS